MLGLGIFKKRNNVTTQVLVGQKRQTAAPSQLRVMRAIAKNQPCHYRAISQHLNCIEGSVTPRIAELRRKGYVKVAHVNAGVAGARVNYYELTGQGMNYLRELAEV